MEGGEGTLWTVVIGVLCGSWVSASRTALATIGARVFRDIGRVWAAGRRQGACLGVGGLLSLAHLQQNPSCTSCVYKRIKRVGICSMEVW